MSGAAKIEFVHVPTPGDHYSAATGSAIMTIIYEVTRVHARHGGNTRVIVSRNTRHDYPIGQCVEVAPTSLPSRMQKAADVGLARLRLPRVFESRAFKPACNAIESGFRGAAFVHNAPLAVLQIKQRCPEARVCLWAHNELFRTFSNRESRRIVENSTYVICVSQFVANSLRQRLDGERAKKVVVIHNGVDIERFSPVAEPPAILNEPPVLLFLGRVDPVKGPDLLIKAASRLLAQGLRFSVRIVGSNNFSALDPLTPYERELRRLAQPLGAAVTFQPFVDRAGVVPEYQKASIFCAPANWNEPFGLTLAEAMACGLPVVTSRRGGIPEVCGDAALYFDPPDVDGLARQLASLLSNAQMRNDLSQRACKRATELTWDRHYDQLIKLFN